MSKRNKKHTDYTKHFKETSGEPVNDIVDLPSDDQSFSLSSTQPPIEPEVSTKSWELFETKVGCLNVRTGPGKGFGNIPNSTIEGLFDPHQYDSNHRLNAGAKLEIRSTTVDGAGNTWGELTYGDAYVCLIDAELDMTFCEPVED